MLPNIIDKMQYLYQNVNQNIFLSLFFVFVFQYLQFN